MKGTRFWFEHDLEKTIISNGREEKETVTTLFIEGVHYGYIEGEIEFDIDSVLYNGTEILALLNYFFGNAHEIDELYNAATRHIYKLINNKVII